MRDKQTVGEGFPLRRDLDQYYLEINECKEQKASLFEFAALESGRRTTMGNVVFV